MKMLGWICVWALSWIPTVIGMPESEAVAALQEVVLDDGSTVEIIKNYVYSQEYEEDIVFEQTPTGEVSAEDGEKVYITVSMGKEPDENLADATEGVGGVSSFGIAAYLSEEDTNASNSSITSLVGINWDNVPFSYEYVYDNSESCWNWGMWKDGVCYKSPPGEYNTDVRHLMQFYCDGHYVYLRIVFATVYAYDACGDNYLFYLDGEQTQYQLALEGEESITGKTEDLGPGTHQLVVEHVDSGLSGEAATGAIAYLLKSEDANTEVQMKIPLGEMWNQNTVIDLENLNTIEFRCYPLMYHNLTASGASTFPWLGAAAAMVIIPGSTILLKRRGKKKVKKPDEKNI
ncbi:MAG: PASTA domain-containing protein [Lachnospiraceae bacterium]|nr:PASTA domain-containing protein [Lachnospiraceae bacterium]